MSRRNVIVRFAAAAVGIVAIAVAAATVSSPVEPGGSGGSGEGSGSGGSITPPAEQPDPSGGFPPILEYLIAIVVLLAAIVAVWYLITHRRDIVKIVAVTLAVAVVVAIASIVLLNVGVGGSPSEEPGLAEPGGEDGEPGPEGEGERETEPISLGPLLAALVLAAGIFVGALVFSRRDDGEPEPGESPSADPDEPDVAAVGAAAGRAADRIVDTDDLDNEVYRAWRDMTRLLDVERPASSTPGEFATAAIDAGLAREHVDELTGLFEDVRYGDAESTAEREERAVDVLRRIESEYADDAASRTSASDGTERRDRRGDPA